MKISFDGVGHHDWLRNRKGAEEDTLRSIKLCKDNGLIVMVQTNVHRLNVDSMLPTAKLLDSMGVDRTRIIRTTEAPRWVQNAGDKMGVDKFKCTFFEKGYLEKLAEVLPDYTSTAYSSTISTV